CPGTQSQDAGKTDSCKGCPNMKICSSGELKKEIDLSKILSNFTNIQSIIFVLSGKGGVGKSSFAANFARYLADHDPNKNVGLLDIDLCGPSIPQMMNISNQKVHQSANGWSPIYVQENLLVMSIGLLLDSLDDAVIWRAPKKNAMIKQFLEDVDWGYDIDFLIIDTPPGTSDEHMSIFSYLKPCLNVNSGAIIITTPQEISLLDVRKEINFCKKSGVHILGVVENMNKFVCPNCHKSSFIFPNHSSNIKLMQQDGVDQISKAVNIESLKIDHFPSNETNVQKMCKDMGVKYLESIPLDINFRKVCDAGESYFEKFPNTPICDIFENIRKKTII
ncbi:unnamed protein product, partial [Gordionus sp. m RMFG-2023]